MITLILAFINSKYRTGYEALFIGSVIIDYNLVLVLGRFLGVI